jgi:type I restriction enzyme S subunit
MSYLKKLLKDVELDYTILGNENFVEIANSGRKPVKASLRVAGEIPYYGANNIQDYVEGFTHEGEYILIAEDGSNNLENYSIQYAAGKFWANNHVHVIRGVKNLTTKYLYHYLKTVKFIPFLSGGDRAKLTKGKLVEIPIVIPPLSVQKEIVRILDTFTKLIAELIAELTTRKKQYNYYREKLLSFEDAEVEWKPLGEVYKFQYGIGNTIPTSGGKYPVYGSNGVVGTHSEYNSENSPVIGHIGAYAGIVNWGKGKHFVTYNGVICKLINENVISRYAYHQLLNQNFNSLAKNSSQPFVSYKELNSVQIPIPSIEEQERIVTILDKFEILTTSISEGLPKEIELRKKQYEYYLDLLLTFPKNNIAS